MINVADTILTQYADSPKLKSLIYSFNEAVGIEGFLDDFYDVIWNIETADTYGLDVWGKIVVVSRQLTVTENQIYLSLYINLCNCLILICSIQHQKQVNLW
ncbi:DUF2612 domain-containing protein, partial [Enterobacter cloacae]|uniref:DUF2612 domain-containing protein n=1 Tax=Enterobacter cloacae TaxID=550 RepID=UPI00315A88A7